MTRLGIFSFYDARGEVDSATEYYLSNIRDLFANLIVVVNGPLTNSSRELLLRFTPTVLERENKGFDIGAYRHVFEKHLRWSLPEDCSSVVLFNDTVFGPIAPIANMFDEMDAREIDFWGVTAHPEMPDVDHGGRIPYSHVPEFLNSYLLSIRPSLFYAKAFRPFWNSLQLDTFEDVLYEFETVFCEHFRRLGFRWGAYVDTDDLRTDERARLDYVSVIPDQLVALRRHPFIRRKLFGFDPNELQRFGHGGELERALSYVRLRNSELFKVIVESITRRFQPYSLTTNLGLDFVIEAETKPIPLPTDVDARKRSESAPRARAVVFAYLFFSDLFEYHLPALVDASRFAAIVVAVVNEDHRARFLELWPADSIRPSVVVVPPQGRDLGCLLEEVCEFAANHELVCFIHDKKSRQSLNFVVGREFANLLWTNLLGRGDYVGRVIAFLCEHPEIGIAAPPPPFHGNYFSIAGNEWTVNLPQATLLAERMCLSVAPAESHPPITFGSAFWFRPQAMKALFDLGLGRKDLSPEPMPGDGTMSHAIERIPSFVAAHHGYLTAHLHSADFVRSELSVFRHRSRFLVQHTRGALGPFAIFEDYARALFALVRRAPNSPFGRLKRTVTSIRRGALSRFRRFRRLVLDGWPWKQREKH